MVEAVTTGEVVAVVTQDLLDELAAVLIRPKFRRWLDVADAVIVTGDADLLDAHLKTSAITPRG